MFFVFHILVFAYLTLTEINCYSQGTTTEGKNYVRKHEAIFNFRAAAQFNETTENSNKFNTDLKSNVFNKILSDEMLSVTHNHDHQDNTDTPFLRMSDKNNLITPTREDKQKWPMFEYLNLNKGEITKMPLPEKNENLNALMHVIMKNGNGAPKNEKLSKIKFHKPTAIQSNLVKNKVVGMRSLTDVPIQMVTKDRSAPGVRMCTCMKTNPSTVCSHSCTGSITASNKKRCTHSTPSARPHDCSRSSVTSHSCNNTPPPFLSTPNPYSFYPAFYVPYTYFGGGISYRVTHPQPNIFDEVKQNRKTKYRKTTPIRYDDDLYYEEDDSEEKNSYNDNSADDDDNFKMVSKKLEKLHKPKKVPTLLMNIDYVDETDKNTEKSINKEGVKYDVNQDKRVKELVNDLKGKHKHPVIKDCFCNSALRIFQTNIFVHLFILLYYCINL